MGCVSRLVWVYTVGVMITVAIAALLTFAAISQDRCYEWAASSAVFSAAGEQSASTSGCRP